MKKPKTDFKRVLSKTGTGFLWLLRILPMIGCALIFILYPSDVLESLTRKIVLLFALLFASGAAMVVLFIVLVALLALLLGALWLSDWRRDKQRGYSIHLSGNGDGGGVYYQEGKHRILMGFDRFPFVIHLPNDEVWSRDAPVWAKGRRAEIIGRIKKQYKHAQYKENGNVLDFSLDKSNAGEFDGQAESGK